MRLQLATLIAAGLVTTAATAIAQEQPPLPPAQPGTPAPATAAGTSSTADPATTAPATAAPATDPAAAPATAPATDPAAAPPAQAAAEPIKMPDLPTSGDGYEVIKILDAICVPTTQGQNLDTLAKANGFKKTKDGWVKQLGAKPYTVRLDFYSTVNPNVCRMTLDYATGGVQPIIDALSTWAYRHEPYMKLYRNDEYNDPGYVARTISWEDADPTDGKITGLVFLGKKKLDGSSYSKVGDQADLLFQVRKDG